MIQIDAIAFSLQRHGGISVYVHELLKQLSKRGVQYQVTVELPTKNQFDMVGSIGCHRPRMGRLLERYRPVRVSPETKLCHSSYYRIPNDPNVKSVVTVYDFIYEKYSKGFARWIHSAQKISAIKNASGIICISKQTRDDLYRYIKTPIKAPIKVIYCGVGNNFTPKADKKHNRPFLLYVGGRSSYKNFHRLAAVMNSQSEYELICVGGGPLTSNELREFSPRAKGAVKHLGFVTENELNNLYNAAHCLMYLSDYEGFGIPVAEALNAGCPVICGNCSAVREVGGDALEVVQDLCAGELLAAIQRLEDRSYRNILIKLGLETGKKFSWESCHNQTIDFYNEIQMA